MDPLLLGSLIGFGFALTEEQVKQAQILESVRTYQALRGTTEAQPIPERTGHQKALVEKASKALENRDYELALSLSERLLKLERSDPLYYVLRGDCRARLGRISAAIEDYDRSLDMNDRAHVLPPYLVRSLKIAVDQLEEIQAAISRSKQEPSLEEISQMLDEAKSKQAEADRTDEPAVPRVTVSDISKLVQDKSSDPLSLFGELDGKSASDPQARLMLYQVCLDTLLKLSHRAFVIFDVDNCRLHTLFSQFLYLGTSSKQFKDVMHGQIGWLPQSLYHVATEGGFHIDPDPQFRDSEIEGGSMFQQDFFKPHPGLLAQVVEQMHLLATADQQYVIRVQNWEERSKPSTG